MRTVPLRGRCVRCRCAADAYGAAARQMRTVPLRGMCGRLVRIFAIDLVQELVRTGRA